MNMLPEIPFLITFMFIIFPSLSMAAILLYYHLAMTAENRRSLGK